MRAANIAQFANVAARAAAGVAPAYQQILDLAVADGWTAVYDPTNPATRTLRESAGSFYVAEIADGLATLSALANAVEAAQPQLLANEFGELSAALGDGTTVGLLHSTTFTPIEQPYTFLVVARAANTNVTMSISGGLRSLGTLGPLFGHDSTGVYRMHAGSVVTGGTSDTSPHVVSALFDGANSTFRRDGVGVFTANANTRNVHQFAMLRRVDSTPEYWSGPVGVLLVRPDRNLTIIGRMEDLLHNLTGIAKA